MATSHGPQKTLVLIDDETSITTHFGTYLSGKGYRVQSFSDGSNIQEWLASNQCDALLLDFHMPGIDGFTLLCMLKQRFPDLPVFFLSGMLCSPEEIEGMKAAGAIGFIRKTAPLEEILAKLESGFPPKPAPRRLRISSGRMLGGGVGRRSRIIKPSGRNSAQVPNK